jgi:hypothetical protein
MDATVNVEAREDAYSRPLALRPALSVEEYLRTQR